MKPIKILLVEDESTESMAIKYNLESFGYEVPYIASNGDEAIFKSLELKPDLVLMDIVLKGDIDGVEAAAKIKDLDIPIIYLSAHSEESTIERAKLTQPYGYIIKPYTKTDLKNTIDLAFYKHKMELKLKESEKKYHRIIENLQDAYIQGDQNGFITMASPSAAHMYKYDSPEEMMGINTRELFKSKSRKILWKNFRENGIISNMECESLRKDGTPFWVSMNVQYIHDENGDIQGIEGFIRDISSTKRFENNLRQSEKFLESIVDNIPDMIFAKSAENLEIILINKAGEELLGRKREELLGKTDHEIFRKELADFFTSNDAKVLKEKELVDTPQEPVFTKDKGERIVHTKKIPLLDDQGNAQYLLGISEDITERIQAEKALADSENKYRTLFNNAADGILLIKGDHFIDCNQRALEIYGTTREQIIGKTPYLIFSPKLQPNGKFSKDQAIKHINQAINGNPQHFKWKHLRYDGTPICTEVFLNRLKIRDEYLLQAIVRDVTSKEKIEKELQESLEENKIISRMVIQLLGVMSANEIYEITGDAVKELLPDSYIIVTGISPDEQNIRIMNILGMESLDKLINMLGIDPYKLNFSIKEIAHNDLKKHQTALLTKYEGGIYDLTLQIIPRPLSNIIEKTFHINEIHSIRFSFEDKHHGGVTIFLKDEQTLKHKKAVETIVKQASIAIRRSRAEESIKRSLNEKEALLREIHHRVKNNMQIITSLLNLQIDSIPEARFKDILRKSQTRIRSMAMIHENIYMSPDLSHINFKNYLENFLPYILYTYQDEKDDIKLNIHIDEIELNMETAIP